MVVEQVEQEADRVRAREVDPVCGEDGLEQLLRCLLAMEADDLVWNSVELLSARTAARSASARRRKARARSTSGRLIEDDALGERVAHGLARPLGLRGLFVADDE